MKEEVKIREASPGDVDAMIELLRQLFAIEADFRFQQDRQRKGLELLFNRPDTVCLVAEVNQPGRAAVVGMATAQMLISTAEGGKKAIVEDMVVTEKFRGRGIGRTLLAALEEWAFQQNIVRLDLLADRCNDPALSFYEKLGWRRTRLVGFQKTLESSSKTNK